MDHDSSNNNNNSSRHVVRVYVGSLSQEYEALSVEASKNTTAEEIVSCIGTKLGFSSPSHYELAEVMMSSLGEECKERRLSPSESPVALKLLWPQNQNFIPKDKFSSPSSKREEFRFCLREKNTQLSPTSSWSQPSFVMDPQLLRDYFLKFLYQPKDKEYPDLCQLPDLNESTLLDNLRGRFNGGHIYSYVGSILIALNPFKFHPIYNPKYVKLYQNRRREELPPHIFAIADSAYHAMLKEKRNQCIVISGESGSGKTESTNFLLHHLTALSSKGTHGSGVEQTILSAGPVLEAFGNAKTAHNNNSSRFGKFIQVSYRENGMVHGAIVQKYLLEKSRICCQAKNERNYHVFYYLLAGANETEKSQLALLPPSAYHYLNQSGCYTLDGVDESYEFSRLKQSMEMVGFGTDKQRKLFSVLSAVLLLGNVEFVAKKSSYHHDESVLVKNPQVVKTISSLLRVAQETLIAALTSKRAKVSGEMLVINYRMSEAIAARDAMAKCLYGALFDWIVLQVNHALLSKKDPSGSEATGKSIGVLDIFGFEDFGNCNSFEQYCINYANEHLQNYFNQHVFKYEQEEYKKEGIKWTNIGYMDNTPCLSLIEAKPNGLICILDDQCNFPGATSETLLQKFNSVQKEHEFYEVPQKREPAFIIRHYAGKVKYQIIEFREKNMDLMRHDIVSVLKNSSLAFVRELVGIDPVAVFRWAILRAFFRAFFAFNEAGHRYRMAKVKSLNRAFSSPGRRRSSNNEHLLNESLCSPKNNEHIETHLLSNGNNTPPELNGGGGDRWTSSIGTKLRVKRGVGSSSRNSYTYTHYYYSRERPYPNIPPTNGINGHLEQQLDSLMMTNGNNNGGGGGGGEHSKECQCCYTTPPPDYTYHLKNRSFRSQPIISRSMKNLASVKSLASHAASMGIYNKHYNPRKQPISVSQQFQQSLHSLMITLNQANPFFIRCIKSNSDKSPNNFDNEIVQRQLRYTGMLETVRIRQAGYNVRLNYDEFINIYRILLPKGLESNRKDVEEFLVSLKLNPTNYQLGKTKIFLREIEKLKLDYFLHQQIMSSIVTIQRWYRTAVERRHFINLRETVIRIQSYIRMFLMQKLVSNLRMRNFAATCIQRMWRGYRVRKWYQNFRSGCIQFQARVRGSIIRQRFQNDLERRRKNSKKSEAEWGQSTDDAFLSQESSQEELNENLKSLEMEDSEEGSSGAHEESENEGIFMRRFSQNSADDKLSTNSPHSIVTHRDKPQVQKTNSHSMLSDSMPALTLALTSTPFALKRNSSPLSRDRTVEIDAKTKKKHSLKLSHHKNHKKDEDQSASNDELNFYGENTESSHNQNNNSPQHHHHGSKNPFHRAKKHIKTFISGSRTKGESKHEAVLLDSGESETEDNSSDTLTLHSTPSLAGDPDLLPPSHPHVRRADYDTGSAHNYSNPRLSSPKKVEQDIGLAHTYSNPRLSPPRRPEPETGVGAPYSTTDRRRSDEERSGVGGYSSSSVVGESSSGLIHIPEEGGGGGGGGSRSRGESREERREERRRLIAERERQKRGSVGSVGGEGGGGGRRGSGGSHSHSSQDSLFESGGGRRRSSGSGGGGQLAQSVSVGYPTTARSGAYAFTSSSLLGSTLASSKEVHRKVHVHDEGTGGDDDEMGAHELLLLRNDVRRTRSVSESRPDSSISSFKGRDYPSTTSFGSSEVSSEELLPSSSSGSTGKKVPPQLHGHYLEKMNKYQKDICTICSKNLHILFAPGYKCTRCRLLFHTKCIQAGGLTPSHSCELNTMKESERGETKRGSLGSETEKSRTNSLSGKRKVRKVSKSTSDMTKPGKFNVQGTSEFTDRTDQIISGVKELQLMQEFISRKIYQVRQKDGEKVTKVDKVFQKALREFKESLVSTFSVASKQGVGMPLNIKYKDLIANFANIMETVCKHEGIGDDFPTTMGVNAFRGFLNEFMNENRVEEKPKASKGRKERRKEKGNKRQKVEEVISHMGHSFVTMVINIPTACEICSSFIMWPIERGVVCQKCKLACHKKCHLKLLCECSDGGSRSNSSGTSEHGVFGSSLSSLTSDSVSIPVLFEHLVTAIEFYGLRSEGLYRKSGVSSRVRELKGEIDEGREISWDVYPVHVLTSVLKSFLRELPEPLLTYELYDEFLRAADLSQVDDRISTTFSILKKLPKVNYDLMERLVFHLVRVALYEENNRMNASSLAIVFAPCILRTNKVRQVQDSLDDIHRQTLCLETIISEQLKKVRTTLSNIESVDSARHSFSVRLNSIRSSKMKSPPERKKGSSESTGSLSEGSTEKSMNESTTPESMSAEEEEEYLTRHLKHLQDEKAMLTSVLPSLSRTPSDEDMLSTDPEVDSPGGSVDDLNIGREGRSPSPRTTRAQSLQYSKSDSLVVDAFKASGLRLSPTLRLPSTSPLLQNIIRNRGPLRKPPSRFVRNLAVVDFGEGEHEEEDEEENFYIEDEEDISVQSVSSHSHHTPTTPDEPIIV